MANGQPPKLALEQVGMISADDALARARRAVTVAASVPSNLSQEKYDQEVNAVSAASDVSDWIFPELGEEVRRDLAHEFLERGKVISQPGHLSFALRQHVQPFKVARDIANATKHRLTLDDVDVYVTASAITSELDSHIVGNWIGKAIDPSTGGRHRLADVAGNLVKFWDEFRPDPVGAVRAYRDKNSAWP